MHKTNFLLYIYSSIRSFRYIMYNNTVIHRIFYLLCICVLKRGDIFRIFYTEKSSNMYAHNMRERNIVCSIICMCSVKISVIPAYILCVCICNKENLKGKHTTSIFVTQCAIYVKVYTSIMNENIESTRIIRSVHRNKENLSQYRNYSKLRVYAYNFTCITPILHFFSELAEK